LLIPKFADDPDGLGTIFTGSVFLGFGFEFALGFTVVATVGFAEGLGVVIDSPSLTVILIFCPGLRFSIWTLAVEPAGEGLIARGALVLDGAGLFEVAEDGLGVGFTDGLGVGFTDGLGVGFTDGLGEALGEGVGVGVTLGVGVGVGVTLGVGVGVGVTLGVGVGVTTDGAGALGAGELGVDETYVTCSGNTGSEICDGAETPTDVTVETVNVYGVPLVRP
jgi:hypothetical protein